MENSQIKSLAVSIAEQNEISDSVCKWIFDNLSKAELRRFLKYLCDAIKQQTVTVKYAGTLSEEIKNKVQKKFADKNIVYSKADEEVVAGVKFEFGDYILDCSVANMAAKIMKNIRENL